MIFSITVPEKYFLCQKQKLSYVESTEQESEHISNQQKFAINYNN